MGGKGKFLGGILMGLGLAFLLDPDRGALVAIEALIDDARRENAFGLLKLADNLDAKTRDLRNRARGSAAELGSRLRREEVDDDTLGARVRSAIGRVVSHPGAIEVDVVDRRVTVRGPVLAAEAHDLIGTVRGVRGVSDVIDETSVHSTAEGVPALQGEGSRSNG